MKQIDDKGATMTRGGKVVRFHYDHSNLLSCRASAYYALSAEARRPSAALWHRRCGHLSPGLLARSVRAGAVSFGTTMARHFRGLPSCESCSSCQE